MAAPVPYNLPRDTNGSPSALPVIRVGTSQHVAYTGTAGAISNAIVAGIVKVNVTTDAYVVFGSAPTATTGDMYLIAGNDYYLAVPVPGTSKLSAVQVSSGGTVVVTEVS